MRFELFKDRNFVAGCVFMVVIGVVLFGTMALVTPFMQNVIGYPILTAGLLLAGRGIGTLVAMIMVGRLLKLVEARYLVLIGLTLAAITLYQMVGFTDQTSSQIDRHRSVVQGFGLGLVFVPLSTVAFATLPVHLRTEGTADPDARAQHRQLDRHLHRHRAADQHGDPHACQSRRVDNAIQ